MKNQRKDAESAKGKADFWLTIFFPNGITWECADGAIRTRWTASGRTQMPARACDGPAQSWLAAARNVWGDSICHWWASHYPAHRPDNLVVHEEAA